MCIVFTETELIIKIVHLLRYLTSAGYCDDVCKLYFYSIKQQLK